MKRTELLSTLIERGIIVETLSSEMYFISLPDASLDGETELLLDTSQMENGTIFLVGETPPWYLTIPSQKEILAFTATNEVNRDILLSLHRTCGTWQFDLDSIEGSDENNGTIAAKFMFIAKIPSIGTVDDVALLIESAIKTYLQTKDSLISFSEKNQDDVTVDDAFPAPDFKVTIDLSGLRHFADTGNEKFDELIKKLDELGFRE